MMTSERINYLHQQFLDGKLSQQEQQEWQQWTSAEQHSEQFLGLIEQTWKQIPDEALSDMPDERSAAIFQAIISPSQRRATSLLRKVAVAASLILAAGTGIWFIAYRQQPVQQQVSLHDVAPGHHGATLTLANGKKIRLTNAANGQLAKEAGVTITKTQNGQLVYEIENRAADDNKVNTLSTEKGETYQVKLPDGSQVWLNSASSLTYRASLSENGKRKVQLTGEGYFEIAKDKAHPFVVQTATQEVEVLGTHFNINSYQDEPGIVTTLLEGSVKVTSGNYEKIIKPGLQVLNNGSGLAVQEANMDQITDWKDGDFNLERIDFRLAMRKIARWYDVDVIYDPSVPQGLRSGGWMSRNNPLSAILRSMEKAGLVHFKVEGRKIYVTK